MPTRATLRAVELEPAALVFDVEVSERGKPEATTLEAVLPLRRPLATVDDLRAELLGLTACSGDELVCLPAAGSRLLTLPGATDAWSLPDNLWLNTTPYPHSVRNMLCALGLNLPYI